jgi:hypothetical protein
MPNDNNYIIRWLCGLTRFRSFALADVAGAFAPTIAGACTTFCNGRFAIASGTAAVTVTFVDRHYYHLRDRSDL